MLSITSWSLSSCSVVDRREPYQSAGSLTWLMVNSDGETVLAVICDWRRWQSLVAEVDAPGVSDMFNPTRPVPCCSVQTTINVLQIWSLHVYPLRIFDTIPAYDRHTDTRRQHILNYHSIGLSSIGSTCQRISCKVGCITYRQQVD